MLASFSDKPTRNSFFLSAILHAALLLLLLNISIFFTIRHPTEEQKKPPQMYIPSYVYHGTMTPKTSHHSSASIQKTAAQNLPITTHKSSPLVSQKKSLSTANSSFGHQSVLAMSQNFIQANQTNTALRHMDNSEPPILLVGDSHATVDPLLKLVGRSLSAHFTYPKMEGTFGVRGRVLVQLVIHPEGYFSDVQIVQSSNNQDFDAAALYAINMAPTVVGIDKFLPTAKRFLVGFIFS